MNVEINIINMPQDKMKVGANVSFVGIDLSKPNVAITLMDVFIKENDESDAITCHVEIPSPLDVSLTIEQVAKNAQETVKRIFGLFPLE